MILYSLDSAMLPTDVSYDQEETLIVNNSKSGKFELNGSAAFLFQKIAGSPNKATLEFLSEAIVAEYQLSKQEAESEAIEFLQLLNDKHLLNINYRTSIYYAFRRVVDIFWMFCTGQIPRFRKIRHRAGVFSLLLSIGGSLLPMLLWSLVYFLLLTGAFLLTTSGINLKATVIFTLPFALLIVFGVTGVMHEGFHLLAAKVLNVKVAYIIRYLGSTTSVIHSGSTRVNRFIAASGPVAGIATGITLAFVGIGFLNDVGITDIFPKIVLLAIILPHAWSLLPWSVDGSRIWRIR